MTGAYTLASTKQIGYYPGELEVLRSKIDWNDARFEGKSDAWLKQWAQFSPERYELSVQAQSENRKRDMVRPRGSCKDAGGAEEVPGIE